MSDSNNSIGKVSLDLETNHEGFNKQLNGIAGKATGMVSQAFSKLGGIVAGAFATKALISFGKQCIDLASDLDEVQNVVDVVFGKSADTINNFAKTALNTYGLSELSAKRYSSTMGAMLKSMGLSDDAVLNMSQSMTALAGDMASFYNLNSDNAFNKIRAGISGETEPLKQLGINMSQANLEAFALSKGITKSYQSMSQSEQALLRYNYLLSTTADAQGNFARTSDSWANQTRILSEQFNTLKSTLGSAFIQILTPVVKMLNWTISKLQIAANYFKSFVEAVTGTKAETSSASSGLDGMAESATDAGDATEAAAKKAKKALAGFDKLNVLSSGDDSSSEDGGIAGLDISTFEGTTVALPEFDTSNAEKAVDKVKTVFGDLKSYVTTSFKPTIDSWGKAFSNLRQPIETAFGKIKTSVSELWTNTFKPFSEYIATDYVPTMVNNFSETLAPIFEDVMPFAIEEFTKDFEFACQQISNYVNDIYQPALELVKNVTTDALGSVRKTWNEYGEDLLTKFGKFRDSIKEIWNNLYQNVIKPVWDKILSGLKEVWDEHLKPLWDTLLEFFAKLGQAIMTVWNNFLAPIINWLIKTFGPVFVAIFGTIWETAKAVFGNLIDAIKNLLKGLGGLLDFITGVFSGDWKKAWNGIKTFFKGVWDSLVDVLKIPLNLIIGYINKLLTCITAGLNLAIKALNQLSFTVPDWIPKIGGQKWGFNIKELTAPTIPYLAKGGIVDQPTLAMVGEKGKEAVVPLENTAFADSIANAIMRVLLPLFNSNKGAGKGNNDSPTVIVLKVGEYELGRVSVGAINKYHNVIGKVELEV